MDQTGMDAGNPAEPSLLGDLGGMIQDPGASASPGPVNPLLGDSDGSGQAAQSFKFAGRDYADQAAAEKSFKTMYGKYSETQGILNTVKKALNDPELLEALSENPMWADIFAKLGIETATEGVDREDVGGRQSPEAQQIYHDMQVARDEQRLEMEEWRFERELGKQLTPEEKRTVYSIIKRASSLTFKEAWQLANHERLLKEARGGGVRPAPAPRGARPAPPPVHVPGSQVNTRKPVNKMNDQEWKDNLANDPDFRNLLSRG